MDAYRNRGAGVFSALPAFHRAKLSGPQSNPPAFGIPTDHVRLLPRGIDFVSDRESSHCGDRSGSVSVRYRHSLDVGAYSDAAQFQGYRELHKNYVKADSRVRLQSLPRAYQWDGFFAIGSVGDRVLSAKYHTSRYVCDRTKIQQSDLNDRPLSRYHSLPRFQPA